MQFRISVAVFLKEDSPFLRLGIALRHAGCKNTSVFSYLSVILGN